MSVDWGAVLGAAVEAAEKAAKPMAPQVKSYLEQIGEMSQITFEDLARALAAGEIDKATFDAEMEDQKRVVQAEMEAIKVMTKAAAQRAANAFIASVSGAIRQAVKAALVF